MRPITLASMGFAVAAMTVPAAALAHHSFAMFDNTKTVTWTGTVAAYDWANPHVHIAVIVAPNASDPNSGGKWDVEAASPNIMSRQGWNRNSFKVGDKITVVVHPLKDGSKGGSLDYAIGKDGKRLYHDVTRPAQGA